MTTCSLTFPFRLPAHRLPNFRAAIVEQLGFGHYLFHGHDNSQPGLTRYSNAYPLVRFCIDRGRARIVAFRSGADAVVRELLPVIPSTLVIDGTPYDTGGYTLRVDGLDSEIGTSYRTFGIYHWLALNGEHYPRWKEQEGNDAARRLLLDRCLTGHLRAFGEAIGFDPAQRQRIVARTLRVDRVKKVIWHNNPFVSFDVLAEANFQPPYGFGVGRCISFGFGEVCSERKYGSLVQKRDKPHRSHADTAGVSW